MNSLARHQRIKVLQLQPDYNVKDHDFSDLAEQIVKCLPSERFEVVSAFLKGKPKHGQPISKADKSFYFEFNDGHLKGTRLRALWRLYKFCRDEKFDVVICNRFKPVNMMLTLNRWLKIPVCIGIAHGFGEYDRLYRRKQVKRMVNDSWRFVGVSPAVKDYLIGCRCGFTELNTVAITNAIDTDQAEKLQLAREEARRQLGLPDHARIIGALGRLVPVKGHIYLIKAFAKISTLFPDAHLSIIGGGREEEALSKEAERLGLSERIHLHGMLPDALKYVKAFDIWAMPSLREGLGLALLEGMSGKLPVIGSDIPAMAPLISGAGGITVPPADVENLSKALEAYLNFTDEQLRAKGEKAYKYLCAEHSITLFREQYLGLIERALIKAGKLDE
jgi:glycosyltransferase involved in cell wall biosynthesis